MLNKNKRLENVYLNFQNTLPNGSQTQCSASNNITALPKFKLPKFNQKNVKLCVLQIDYKLAMYNITAERSKFNAVISALPVNVLESVADLLTSPPVKDPYQVLKNCIVKEFEESNMKKLTSLLQDCELGDQCPTQLLTENEAV